VLSDPCKPANQGLESAFGVTGKVHFDHLRLGQVCQDFVVVQLMRVFELTGKYYVGEDTFKASQ
jgi:hypothetical protein